MKKRDKNVKLESISCGTRPKVLLLGNGINLSFLEAKETNDFLEKLYEKNYSVEERNLEEFCKLTFPMKVIVATKDHVSTCMKELAEQFKIQMIVDEQKNFLSYVLSKNWQAILTTNYSLEIEQAIIPDFSVGKIAQYYRYTNENHSSNDKYNLFRCIQDSIEDASLWHIHGIALKKDSMIMGHYYYGELLSHIIEQAASTIKKYKGSESYGTPFYPKSWVDYFLIGDVYCMGFGLDLSELDIWWLLENKKLHFPESHFYFFEPNSIEASKEMMLKSYGVICPREIKKKNDDYVGYYINVCNSYGN